MRSRTVLRDATALRELALLATAIPIVGIVGVFAATTAWAGTPATTAADICASNANPCNVTSVYDITANAVLDFGTRSVNVTGAGEFNFGSGSGRIACGNFTASTTAAFLTAAGPAPSSGTTSGSVLLLARRRCTSLNPLVPCLDLADCELGPCGARRCSKKTTKTCLADGDCQIGPCSSLRRCAGSANFVRCSTNADCDYGTCPAQLTCAGRGDNPVNCSGNGDCSFGTCTVGTASVMMDGPVAGSSDYPATLVIRAADSISISKPVNLNSSSLDSDGGNLSVDARAGSITVSDKINATAGGSGQGGSVEFNAGMDIVIYDDIRVIGADFDGGVIDFTSGRDVTIRGSLLANSIVGAGFGGEIAIAAGRDLSFSGVSASNKSTMETSGHTDAYNSAGDGGIQEFFAGRNLTFDANTRLIGTGSAPDGSGADVFVESGAGLVMNGDVTAKAIGIQGSGGFVEIIAGGGTASVGTTATFDVTGGSIGGGSLEIDSISGDLSFAGACDVSGGNGGNGGSAFLTARQSASVAGDMFVAGAGGGNLGVDGCRVTLAAGASLDNSGTGGRNTLVAHDDMKLLAGSSMTADSSGTNTLRYRTASKPPLVEGTVSPAPARVVDPSLSDCPLCGNSAVDAGESCDDGNAAGGDGCSTGCQNEKCLAQTISPGYPTVALCEDGNVCTADVCNTALGGGTCQHPAKNCSDAIACTIDSCDADDGTCRHSATDSMCDDTNACTDDFCSPTTGCSNTANSSPCDDRNRCTTNDVCSSKVCRGTRINGCLFCGDDYVNPLAAEQCDDGNDASGDCCSSTCRYEATNSPCEDGLFCTVDDKCNGTGTCLTGPPNTCADTDACTADSCNEDTARCVNAQSPRDAAACMVAPGTKFQIRNSARTGKDKLSWQWSRGDAFLQADLGTPDVDTGYTLCVYDETATASSLKASIDIAPSATLWENNAPSGLEYQDKAGTAEGLLKAQFRTGEAGSTRVRVGFGGANLVLPAPAGASFFSQDPNVVVQLVNGTGKCWTSQFSTGDTRNNDAALFKAATK